MANDTLTPEEANQLFNDVSKAMQEDDNTKLSSLLAVETPEIKEPPTQDPPDKDDKDDQPDPLVDKDKEEKTPLESGDEPDDKAAKPEDKGEKKPDEVELTSEQKRVAELQAQLDAAQKDNQSLRSQAGRVPHIQRRLAELDKKLGELKTPSPSSQTSTKIKPKVDKLLEGLKETDPALADTVAAAIAAAMDGVDEEMRTRDESTLTLLREQESLEYEQNQAERLITLFPNAPQVFASPHWADWKKNQPKHILALATSDSADAVAMAFDLYAKDMQAKYPELVSKKTEVQDKKPDPVEVEKATKLEQERLRKKTTEVDLNGSKAGARVPEPKDPQALFEHFTKEIAAGRM